jgi:NADPH:quinone reductase-like Zn-dependent oxidoreductase
VLVAFLKIVVMFKREFLIGRSKKGTYTKYTTTSIEEISLKPAELGFDEAITIPADALSAWLTLLHDGKVERCSCNWDFLHQKCSLCVLT